MQSCGKLQLSLVISDCSGGGHGHAAAAGARAGPGGRPGLAGGGHTVGEVCGATCVRLRHLRAGVAGLRGAGPAAAGGLAPLRRGGEVRPRVHWVRGHQGQQRQCHHPRVEQEKWRKRNVVLQMDLLDQVAHLKPQIRKNITITKYKVVKQEQGSLVFNLQVPEVPPSGQQAAPEQSSH